MASKNGEFPLKKVVSLKTLADLSALSVRQIQRLVKDGVISLAQDRSGKPIRSRVVLGEAMPKLFEYSRNTHAVGDPSIASFRSARARREEADAGMAEIELGYQQGKYLLASAVGEVLERMILAFRARMLALPHTVSHVVTTMVDSDKLTRQERVRQVRELIQAKVYEALNEIADLNKIGQKDRDQKVREWELRNGSSEATAD